MLDAQYLFSNPPTSVCDVLGLIFSIFSSNWKSFVILSMLYYLSIFAASFIAGIISFFAFTDAVEEISSNIGIPIGGTSTKTTTTSYGRHLLDYTIGTSVASRALQIYYGNDSSDTDFDEIDFDEATTDALKSITFELICICIIFGIILCVVASIFTGALSHAVAEVYTGKSRESSSPSPSSPSPPSSVSRSMAHGWKQKWKVYMFQILWMLVVISILLVDIGILAAATTKNGSGTAVVWIGVIVAVIMLVILGTFFITAIPSIVIENKMPCEAFRRSYNLCKHYFCFIFGNILTFNILTLIFTTVMNLILDKAPAVLSFIVHLIINMIMLSFGPILVMVLYMSIRIRSEQLTCQELSDELSPPVSATTNDNDRASTKHIDV